MTRPGNKRLLASQRSNGKNFIDQQSRFNNTIYNDIKKKEVIGDSKLVVGSGKNEKITIQTDGNDYTLTLNGDATLPVVGGSGVTGLTVNSQTHDITITNNNTTAGDSTTNTLGDRTISLGGNLTTVSNDIIFDTGSSSRTVRLGGNFTTNPGTSVEFDGNKAEFLMNGKLSIGSPTVSRRGDITIKSDSGNARSVTLGGNITTNPPVGGGSSDLTINMPAGNRDVELIGDLTVGGALSGIGTGDITISSDSATARSVTLGGNIESYGDVKIDGRIFVSSSDAEYNSGLLILTVSPSGPGASTAVDLGFTNGQDISINPAPGFPGSLLNITTNLTPSTTVVISSIIGTVYSGSNVILGTGSNANKIMINITAVVGGSNSGNVDRNIVVTGGTNNIRFGGEFITHGPLTKVVGVDAPSSYSAITHGISGSGADSTINTALDALSTQISNIITMLRGGDNDKVLVT